MKSHRFGSLDVAKINIFCFRFGEKLINPYVTRLLVCCLCDELIRHGSGSNFNVSQTTRAQKKFFHSYQFVYIDESFF